MKPAVLIVGGGYTGLTAAWELTRDPALAVTIIEKGAACGGLASGFTLGGHPLEKAYHHLFRTDRDILTLVEELGLAEELEWRESSLAVLRDGAFHAFSGPADLLRFRPLPWWDRVRLGLVVLYLQKYSRGVRLAPFKATAWMRRWAGRRSSEVLWQPLLRGKFAYAADEISMAWLWARIHIRANSRQGGGPEQLGYFRHGFASVTERLVTRCREAGHTLRTGTELRQLVHREGQWWADWGEGARPFSAVAFTGSCPQFLSFCAHHALALPPETERRLRRVRYLGAVCLVFTYPEALTAAYWNNLNDPGLPFLVLIRHTALVPPQRYAGHHVYYLASYVDMGHTDFRLPTEELIQQWFSALRRILPSFAPERVAETHLFRFRDAQHIVDTEYAHHLPPRQILPEGLFLANFAQVYPEDRGTNYAVREGKSLASILHSYVSP